MPFTKTQERWLQLLETTTIPQTTNTLQDVETGGMCCLGIGCMMIGLEAIPSIYSPVMCFEGHTATAPKALRDALGLRSDTGSPIPYHDLPDLVSLNDDGLTFKEIAAHIRDNPKEYFR